MQQLRLLYDRLIRMKLSLREMAKDREGHQRRSPSIVPPRRKMVPHDFIDIDDEDVVIQHFLQ